jgi:hypothetical protein
LTTSNGLKVLVECEPVVIVSCLQGISPVRFLIAFTQSGKGVRSHIEKLLVTETSGAELSRLLRDVKRSPTIHE